MLELIPSKHSQKFLKSIHPRHKAQLKAKLLSLKSESPSSDTKQLAGCDFHRVDAGEFRITYKVVENNLYITLVGKHNDDEVYKKLKRLL